MTVRAREADVARLVLLAQEGGELLASREGQSLGELLASRPSGTDLVSDFFALLNAAVQQNPGLREMMTKEPNKGMEEVLQAVRHLHWKPVSPVYQPLRRLPQSPATSPAARSPRGKMPRAA